MSEKPKACDCGNPDCNGEGYNIDLQEAIAKAKPLADALRQTINAHAESLNGELPAHVVMLSMRMIRVYLINHGMDFGDLLALESVFDMHAGLPQAEVRLVPIKLHAPKGGDA
ncbi:MAG: hypothetical protein ABW123_06165 [Cystobacter sp.]